MYFNHIIKLIKKNDIIKKLRGMPTIKVHCSVLGIEALQKAIRDYKKKQKNLSKKNTKNQPIKNVMTEINFKLNK